MAGKARKDLAKSNKEALSLLHFMSAVFNMLFCVFAAIGGNRSWTPYIVLSIPSFIAQYILETTGRPKYNVLNGKSTLRTAGEDLSAPGLTEYMFDVIWVTWACYVAVILVGNMGWWLYAVVPVFGAWKAWGLFGAARGMMGAGQSQGAATGMEQQQPAMNRKQRRMAA